MYLGIDDTDSREGMCTTYVGLHAILKIMDLGMDIIGYPRLVRLNPNIPWKTRGNGSVVIRFGAGRGKRFKIGEFQNRVIYAYEREKRDEIRISLDTLTPELERLFIIEDENTNPGLVMSAKKLPERLYWKGVRGILKIEDVERELRETGAEWKKYKSGRGIIGASAGIAWRARRKTYEILTYTSKEERYVNDESVRRMDRTVKSTFDNYDYENDYIAIMPNSKTPVLFGIRGTNPMDLESAMRMVESSPYDGYLIYETNQGSDDHIVKKRVKDVREYESVLLRGLVSREPHRIEGGHVIFTLSDGTGEIDCAAYEPTKGFRDIIMSLYPGDRVEVYGGIRKDRKTVNVEKINILKAVPVRTKVSNPTCPVCGRKMESVGKGKGYRCRRCGTRAGEEDAEFREVERIKEGFYEVPVIARRHLARPLKLIMENIF